MNQTHKLITESRNELLRKIVNTLALKSSEISEMVSLYGDVQHLRIQYANRDRTEGHSELAEWLDYWNGAGETVIYNALQRWIESDDASAEAKWAYEQVGIGPVIAAGLAAHIDVTKAPSISSLWKFAGQAPGYDRKKKGQKLPYNARLKTLAWKVGESFCKVSNKDGATYGHLYAQFKRDEVMRNDAGQYAEAAKRELSSKKIQEKKTKETLESGKLIDAHLHARAKRRAVKIFLAHYWTRGREGRGLPVRDPYPIGIMGHSGLIAAA